MTGITLLGMVMLVIAFRAEGSALGDFLRFAVENALQDIGASCAVLLSTHGLVFANQS